MEDETLGYCERCNNIIRYNIRENEFWDDTGYMYSTKYFKCPHCGRLSVIDYEEDRWISENEIKKTFRLSIIK